MTTTWQDFVSTIRKTPKQPLVKQPSEIKNIVLHSHQLVGVNWLLALEEQGIGGILADEMGLGKTIQTIAFAAELQARGRGRLPVLIISPLSVVQHWMQSVRNFAPSLAPFTLQYTGEATKRAAIRAQISSKTLILVTTYELILSDIHLIHSTAFRPHALVVDEGHRLKNPKTKLYQALSFYYGSFASQSCPTRVLLTGTPVHNHLRELHALLRFVGPPDLFGGCKGTINVSTPEDAMEYQPKTSSTVSDADAESPALLPLPAFLQTFARLAEAGAGSARHDLRVLLSPFMLRRTKADSQHPLPPLEETVLFTDLSEMQRQLYRLILQGKVSEQKRSVLLNLGNRVSLNNVVSQLRKACNHPYLFDGMEAEPFEEGDHIWRNSGKLRVLERLLPRLAAGGHRALMFSQSTRFLDVVQDYLDFRNYEYERLDGSVRGQDRWAAVQRFQEKRAFVFLLSTRAGGTGLNLTAADTVILLDSDYSPAADIQAVARAHRCGQDKTVRVIRLISAHTVEEVVLLKGLQKLKLSTAVMTAQKGDGPNVQSSAMELKQIIQFGLDKIFSDSAPANSQLSDAQIDQAIAQVMDSDRSASQPADKGRRRWMSVDDIITTTTAAQPDARVLERLVSESAAKDDAVTYMGGTRRRKRRSPSNLVLDMVPESRKVKKAKRLERLQSKWLQESYVSHALHGDSSSSEDECEAQLQPDGALCYSVGDVTRPKTPSGQAAIIVHAVDASGAWGRGGVFDSLLRVCPTIAQMYSRAKHCTDLRLGDAHLLPARFTAVAPRYVCLIVLQSAGRRTPAKQSTLAACLARICRAAKLLSASVHVPRFDSGLSWYSVERSLRKYLVQRAVPVHVYYWKRGMATPRRRPTKRSAGHVTSQHAARNLALAKPKSKVKTEITKRKLECAPAPPSKRLAKPLTGDALAGCTVVITGVLDCMERAQAADIVRRNGGRVTGSVSGKTTYLLAGERLEDGRKVENGTKYKKAIKVGTAIVSESELLGIIRSKGGVLPDLSVPTTAVLPPDTASLASALWTDRFRPRSFAELVGNQSKAAALHRWLEGWDAKHLRAPLPKVTKIPAKGMEKAILLAGPPGVGKSTAATLVARLLGFEVVELSARDRRSAKAIQELEIASTTATLQFGSSATRKVLLLDEVDRGGASAIMKTIACSRNPIVCICNDLGSKKMSTLKTRCQVLRFSRPPTDAIAARLYEMVTKEGMKLSFEAVQALTVAASNDMRQALNSLQLWTAGMVGEGLPHFSALPKRGLLMDEVLQLTAHDAARTIFNSEHKSFAERFAAYFVDYSLVSLLVHEHYVACFSEDHQSLCDVADAAEALSASEVMASHTLQDWSMLKYVACMNVAAGRLTPGVPSCRVAFPCWFGKNSARRKRTRLLGELAMHVKHCVTGGPEVVRQDYLPLLRERCVRPLLRHGKAGVPEVVSFMTDYGLSREDVMDTMPLLQVGPEHERVPGVLKTALKRAYARNAPLTQAQALNAPEELVKKQTNRAKSKRKKRK